MAGIGHNSGLIEEPGQTWRTHVWRKARNDLMPRLPIEVVRRRVRRAAELGLPYKTYAGIRASSGHDLIGFMFSSNALRVFRDGQAMPLDRLSVINGLKDCARVGLVHRPLSTGALVPPMERAFAAPAFVGSWAQMRDHLSEIVRDVGQPADRFVLVGETALEHEWSGAMKAAGFLTGDTYFSVNG